MDQRNQILILRYRYGYSIRRIAKITGIPKSTVHKRLKRRPAIFLDYLCRHQVALIQGPCRHGATHKVPSIVIYLCRQEVYNTRDISNGKAHPHTKK